MSAITMDLGQFGEWRVRLVEAGGLSLDGGSMFGSVPRGLWQRLIEPDAQHRIALCMRLLTLEHSRLGHRVLIDTGLGEKYDSSFAERFACSEAEPGANSTLSRALGAIGWSLDEVSHLILTHLHFDHGGGISRREADGSLRPNFAEAEHFLQRSNYLLAQQPNARERASYLPENVSPLAEVSLTLLEGEEEILPGLSVCPSNGHTEGMQTVRIEGGGQVLYYLADLAPTHHHLHIPFTMGFDLSAREIMQEKSLLLAKALEEEATVVFEHDTQRSHGKLQQFKHKYCLSSE